MNVYRRVKSWEPYVQLVSIGKCKSQRRQSKNLCVSIVRFKEFLGLVCFLGCPLSTFFLSESGDIQNAYSRYTDF
jgi:hypothetical protein